MLRAYLDTVDYEGETEQDALAETRSTLDGSKGPMLWQMSNVTERDDRLAAATLVIRWKGEPLVAFSMTDPDYKRQGLARAGLLDSMYRLRSAGETTLTLFVTQANEPAVRLYTALGFVARVRSRRNPATRSRHIPAT